MRCQARTTILFTFAFLASLCFQTRAFPLFRNNFMMKAHASSSGRVELKKDSANGFYVDADFASSEPPHTSSNSSGAVIFDAVKMMISIANEDTFVASSCLNFNPYDCSRYNCSTYNITTNIDFPTFSAAASTQIKSYIYLDYQYWNIDDSYFYIADSCTTGDTTTGLGTGRSGVFGLGTGPLSKSDYLKAQLFSILIDSDLTKGELLFMKESKYTQSRPLYTFKGNSTWQIPTDSAAYIKFLSSAASTVSLPNLNVMFDVNSDAIGLPEELYKTFLSKFLGIPGIWCNSDYHRPYCSTTQKLEDLPAIILSVNSTQIIIPYQIYASEPTKSKTSTFFYFNFKATGVDLPSSQYVSPSFKRSIILDAHFMSYYYTIFDGTSADNVIQIYSTTISDSQPSFAKWIVFVAFGVILLVGVVGICYWLKKRKDIDNKNYAQTIPTMTDGFDTTTQAPLVHHQQEANNMVSNDAENAINSNESQIQVYPQLEDPGYVPPIATEDFKEKAKA